MAYSNKSTVEYEQPEADEIEAKRICKRWDSLDKESSNFQSLWQEAYTYIVPRKENILSEVNPGTENADDLYDTTAILANEMLASALHGMLTNPELRFFEITFNDPELDDDEEVKQWCQETGDLMFRVLNSSNFQTEIYEVYLDLGAIGTSVLFMGEHEEDVVQFSARSMAEVRVDENTIGRIDTVYRKFKLKPEAVIRMFGEKKMHPHVIECLEKSPDKDLVIIHAVEPKHSKKSDLKKHAFKSTYVLKDKKFVLSKDGYREFPYATPRWSKTTGEKYGRGPGMQMLADIRMVNTMMLTVLKGAQKTVDPPLMVQDDGVIGAVRLTPGGLTLVRPGTDRILPLITDARIDFGQQMLEDVRRRIRAGFYVDQLQLKDGPQMTAEEVRQRAEDNLRLMGPVLGRQHFELLKPVIDRLFEILVRRKMIKNIPAKIRGRKFEVRYSSMMARAQRMSEGQNMMRAIQLLAPIAQLRGPEGLDLIKTDGVIRDVWSIYGLAEKNLYTEREITPLRQARAQAQQAAMDQAKKQSDSEVAKNVAPVITAIRGKNGNAQG
jgi:hypothetical protein